MNSKTISHLFAPFALAALLSACTTHRAATTTPALPLTNALARMPEAVTSFAAATQDGWLYVCGGHKGERHDYNAEMVSGSFFRLRLDDGSQWETLTSVSPAQGVPLVAYGNHLYRTGGMAARNPPGTKQDLFSRAEVLRYDPRRAVWEELPPLPEPRSSHDAVVVGSKLYVGGGWQLSGGTNKAVWPDSLLVLDLAKPGAGWKKLPQPFQRRALAAAALGPRIFFIGGMDSDNSPTLAVNIYNTATGQWSQGPDLPPGKFKGFSCSAITQDGQVFANTFQGDLLRLAPDEQSWEVVGRLQHPRMAHRLVTAGTTQLIALGGEDGEDKRPDLELLTPSSTAQAATQSKTLDTVAR